MAEEMLLYLEIDHVLIPFYNRRGTFGNPTASKYRSGARASHVAHRAGTDEVIKRYCQQHTFPPGRPLRLTPKHQELNEIQHRTSDCPEPSA